MRAELLTAVLASLAPLAAQSPLADVVKAFAPCDIDGDGIAEVERLESLHEAGDTKSPLVVIVVEASLLLVPQGDEARTRIGPEAADELRERVLRYGADVAAAGFRAVVVGATVHHGPPHQDGRTVLALRRLFQRLHATSPMAGAVLVGHFPDALLVRTCNWRRNEPLSLPGVDGKPVAIDAKITNVRCVPEIVAHRCDVVLADLDGAWEDVYVPGPAALPSVTAVFGDQVPDAGGACVAMQTSEMKVVDVFHVRDGAAVADREAFTVALDAADRDHECAAADKLLGNPLAQPDIAVSRIDARGIALRCSEENFASAFYAFSAKDPVPMPEAPLQRNVRWSPDAQRERAFLIDYFDRNHAFRTKPLPKEHRKPASASHELGSGLASLRAADPSWREFAEAGYDVPGADLLALMRWLQRPAVLRTLRAHSDPWGAQFAATDPAALTKELGTPWAWVREGERYVPSWKDHKGGRADYAFYRALHDKKVLSDNPYLLIHTGCEAMSPPGSVEHAYDSRHYGLRAHAESILFFTPCLAIVGRAKVFYDEPRGFCEALAAGATFGDAWRRYFAVEGDAKDWNEVGDDIGRKRSYFWSVIGDWTLRLPK
ncbi:MAG TPA: hypothetical protein VF384_11985 [Planctomycetota bacterium]